MFSLIGSHFQIDETGDRCSAHDRLLEREYDLIIVDVRWSKWTETELIAEILRIYLHPRILFFAHSAHKDAIGGYVGQGCWAFVDKYDSKIADIRTAVGKLLDGKNYMSSILLTHLVG
jgi:DNA-binding NarL/FixJ family response regulator